VSAFRNGSPVFTTMELMADFGQPLNKDALCTCCNRACLYAIRYPDRDTVFLCRYCDTEKGGA
jgi:hypothetical protein